jgi:hypothetical protein
MRKPTIAFPLAMMDVASLLVYAEGVPSFSDTPSPPMRGQRSPATKKQQMRDPRDFIKGVHTGPTTSTAYRDFTEMCHAGASVLNSAWGQFAAEQAIKKGPGTRAAFETDMPAMMVRVGQGDKVGFEKMSLARMILEAAPDSFGVPIKVHAFLPRRSYEYGRPWCEFRPAGGGHPVLVFDLP